MEGTPLRQPIAALPPEEVEKICAGEVVERPLSVVKELVENALDAGASEIKVELEDGGKQLIRVSDNGSGIPFSELPLALKPHCTSKIRSLNDLYNLGTLGFRGEALSAIAAVSKFRLASHHAGDELGGVIEVHGGKVVAHEHTNIRQGTEIEVRELFYNTPVRLKFLRSRQAETSQVSTLLTTYALARPQVRWELYSGARKLVSTLGSESISAVFSSLIDRELAEGLSEIDFEFPPHRVHGLISAPHLHRHNRQRQWYFVNGRPVGNKLLYRAVDDAVREFMSQGKFPAGVFFIELEPEEVDVNVHPMKSEVNFANPQEVYSLLSTAVRRALGEAAQQRQRRLTRGLSTVISPVEEPPGTKQSAKTGGGPATEDLAQFDPDDAPDVPAGLRTIPVFEADKPFVPPGLTEPAEPRPAGPREIEFPPVSPQIQQQPSTVTPAEPNRLPAVKTVTQVGASYLVMVTQEEIFLVDQHAAHERILFESLYERFNEAGAGQPRQKLLFPLVIKLTTGEAELAGEYCEALEALGFRLELGAAGNLVISEIPQLLAGRVSEEFIHATLEEIAQHPHSSLVAEQVKELAASLACRAAIKAGHFLSNDEQRDLVRQLLARWSSLSCPHGRPTIIALSKNELEKLFLR